MFKKLCLLSIMVFTLALVSTDKAKAQQSVTLDLFYDQLAPYGHWEDVDALGWVWKPYGTQPGWRPYSDGYWVYTEYGWTYQADNDWSWAAYHYGRWAYLDNYGWVWVPGTEWAPAWVAWRNGDNYIGWAPLPPQAEWNAGAGLHFRNFNIDVDIHWSNWSFVDVDHFDNPRLNLYLQNIARNVTFIRRTRNITRYDYDNHRIINRCIDADNWVRISHRPLVRYNVAEAPSYRRAGVSRAAGRAEIRVYRPQFESRQPQSAPRINQNRYDLSNTRTYNKERSKYDKHYDNEYYKLIENQRKEEASSNQRREEVQRQHNAEIDAYREQRNRDTRVLETRHVNDMDKVVRKNPMNDNKSRSQSDSRNKNSNRGQKTDNQQQNQQPSRR